MRNKYHEQLELSEWMVELCEKVIDRSMVSTGILSLTLPVFSYLTTVLSYAFVALVLFRRRHDRRSVSSKQKDHSATWRLGVHMGVFTLSFCFMALAYIATFPMVFIRLHICLFMFFRLIVVWTGVTSWLHNTLVTFKIMGPAQSTPYRENKKAKNVI